MSKPEVSNSILIMEHEIQPQEPEILPFDELINMALFAEDISGSPAECVDNLNNLLEKNNAKLPTNEVVYIEGYVSDGETEPYLVKDSYAMTDYAMLRDKEKRPRLAIRCLVSDQTEDGLYAWSREQKFITFLVTDMQQITSVSELFLDVENPGEQVPAELDSEVLRDYYRDLVMSDEFRYSDKDRQQTLVSNMIELISERNITHGNLELSCQYYMLEGENNTILEIELPETTEQIVGHSVGITYGPVDKARLTDDLLPAERDLMIAVQTSSTENSLGYKEGDIILVPIHQNLKITPLN